MNFNQTKEYLLNILKIINLIKNRKKNSYNSYNSYTSFFVQSIKRSLTVYVKTFGSDCIVNKYNIASDCAEN